MKNRTREILTRLVEQEIDNLESLNPTKSIMESRKDCQEILDEISETEQISEQNKIGEVAMFRIPEDWDEINDWIELHPPLERPHLITVAMMAWNLAATITNEK